MENFKLLQPNEYEWSEIAVVESQRDTTESHCKSVGKNINGYLNQPIILMPYDNNNALLELDYSIDAEVLGDKDDTGIKYVVLSGHHRLLAIKNELCNSYPNSKPQLILSVNSKREDLAIIETGKPWNIESQIKRCSNEPGNSIKQEATYLVDKFEGEKSGEYSKKGKPIRLRDGLKLDEFGKWTMNEVVNAYSHGIDTAGDNIKNGTYKLDKTKGSFVVRNTVKFLEMFDNIRRGRVARTFSLIHSIYPDFNFVNFIDGWELLKSEAFEKDNRLKEYLELNDPTSKTNGEGYVNLCKLIIDIVFIRNYHKEFHGDMKTIAHKLNKGSKCKGWQKKCGSEKDLQVDHKTSRRNGGKSSIFNAQILCKLCNVSKSAENDIT